MRGELGVVLPEAHLARGERGGQIDDALIGRAAEPQRDLVLRSDVGSVYQDVDAAQQTVGDVGVATPTLQQVLEHIAGEAPDALLGEALLHALDERDQVALVLGLHRLAAEQREAVDVARLEALQDALLDLLCERLPRREVLRFLVEAPRAMQAAARHEQRRAHAFAVGDVAVFDLRKVHTAPLPNTDVVPAPCAASYREPTSQETLLSAR